VNSLLVYTLYHLITKCITVSKAIVDAHRGSISVFSEGLGKGCVFMIELNGELNFHPSFVVDATAIEDCDINDQNGVELSNNAPGNIDFNGISVEESMITFVPHSSCSSEGTSANDIVGESKSDNYPLTPRSHVDDYGINSIEIESPQSLSPENHTSKNNKKFECALVVDDSKLNRKMVCSCIKGHFKTIIERDNGLDAVDVVKEYLEQGKQFDVIFMDSIMPKMSGIEACKQIRHFNYSGLIIAITGNILPEDIDAFIEAGADDVLGKPIKLEQLDAIFQSMY
jgi:CheY-like chemotaxis protein